mmetsp:Transcript_13574/g.40457  ORF Transcript_13574/g.40457 Transcript_13574/m.40457 type:complete len:113 (-) Transcript_13574:225-563(-)
MSISAMSSPVVDVVTGRPTALVEERLSLDLLIDRLDLFEREEAPDRLDLPDCLDPSDTSDTAIIDLNEYSESLSTMSDSAPPFRPRGGRPLGEAALLPNAFASLIWMARSFM